MAQSPTEKANQQFEAKKTFESEIVAAETAGKEAQQAAIADQKAQGLKYGIPADEYDKMDYPAQMRVQMRDPNSTLRNQETPEDVANFQLLSNTNAEIVAAMTGLTLSQLQERATKLNITLKGSLAGNGAPGAH